MSIPYTSEDFTTPRAGGESWVEYPFIEYGDNSTKVYHMRCTVNKSDYTAIALDTTMASASNADVLTLPFAADTSAYFVGDFNHRVIDGALLEFDRQFATIPATNEDYPGTEFFTFPGLPNTTSGASINVSNVSYSLGITTLTTASAHGMVAGNVFRFFYTYSAGGGIVINSSIYLTCETGTSGSTIKANTILGTYAITAASVIPNATRGRGPTNLSSSTKIINEYFLPGVTTNISTVQDINLFETFQPFLSSSGENVDTLTTVTIPTINNYNQSVNDNDYLVIDCAIERYKGNIYVRKTKEITAK
jgi:hypothetical protein